MHYKFLWRNLKYLYGSSIETVSHKIFSQFIPLDASVICVYSFHVFFSVFRLPQDMLHYILLVLQFHAMDQSFSWTYLILISGGLSRVVIFHDGLITVRIHKNSYNESVKMITVPIERSWHFEWCGVLYATEAIARLALIMAALPSQEAN